MAYSKNEWQCNFCHFMNRMELNNENRNKELQICENCGLGFPTRRVLAYLNQLHPNDPTNGMCLPVRDLISIIPKGPKGDKWVDPKGEEYSEGDYIKIHEINPRIYWEYKNKKRCQ